MWALPIHSIERLFASRKAWKCLEAINTATLFVRSVQIDDRSKIIGDNNV